MRARPPAPYLGHNQRLPRSHAEGRHHQGAEITRNVDSRPAARSHLRAARVVQVLRYQRLGGGVQRLGLSHLVSRHNRHRGAIRGGAAIARPYGRVRRDPHHLRDARRDGDAPRVRSRAPHDERSRSARTRDDRAGYSATTIELTSRALGGPVPKISGLSAITEAFRSETRIVVQPVAFGCLRSWARNTVAMPPRPTSRSIA